MYAVAEQCVQLPKQAIKYKTKVVNYVHKMDKNRQKKSCTILKTGSDYNI